MIDAYFLCGQSLAEQPEQPQEHLPFLLFLTMTITTASTAAAITAVRMISNGLIPHLYINNPPTVKVTNAATHAKTVCHTTTPAAHFLPSSRLTEAIVATHGL